jgi:CRISPR-associated protein Csb3
MHAASIPVDLFNPGYVFACLGFLECADLLLGDAEGGFDWSNTTGATFRLHTKSKRNPFEEILAFLAKAEVEIIRPKDVEGPWPEKARAEAEFPAPLKELLKSNRKGYTASALPISLTDGKLAVPISNWLEGDGRSVLKLFAGQQIGAQLALNMLKGDPQKNGTVGHRHLFTKIQDAGCRDPFGEIGPVGGRFGYDACGAWDAIRLGTSLDLQGVFVEVSPCVEILAALGLEHARPRFASTYEIEYAAWKRNLPPALARVALIAPEALLPRYQCRFFRAHLGDDQQYKKCFFAQEEARVWQS